MKRFLFLLLWAGLPVQASDLYDLSLFELTQVKVKNFGSLTKSEVSKVPASMTHISSEMIRHSGARHLDELLELYVPNFQRAKSGGAGPHFGMRGIISDLDNKTLLLVNGKVMNDKTSYGALSERHLPVLGDIATIEVVRGPGSAIYGPGAINGVISIETFTPTTFKDGTEINVRQGVVEEFSVAEVRHGHHFSEDSGLFLSVGMYDYIGASPEDSPLSFSKDGAFFAAGESISDANVVNDNNGESDYKLHLHFQKKNFDFWVRRTSAMIGHTNVRHRVENNGSFVNSGRGTEYTHNTVAAKQELLFSDGLSLSVEGSYDKFRAIRTLGVSQNVALNDSEAELNLKTLLSWDIDSTHALALGFELSRERYVISALSPEYTSTHSFMTEYQWNINDRWTIFAGGRVDKHSYSDFIYSPKAAVIFSPSAEHQLKLIANQGARKSEQPELKLRYESDLEPEIETIDSIELRHDWQISQQLTSGLTYFYYEHGILGFLPQEARETTIGTSQVHGLEFELKYKKDKHEFLFSHGYTKLLDFNLSSLSLLNQVVTSEPYGYGDDLQNWSNHISKLNWGRVLKSQWRFNSSLVVYWGYQGAEDYTAYNNEVLNARNRSQSDGRTEPFDASIFLNSALQYQLDDDKRITVNLYNILGLVDKDFNKRNFYGRMAGYRREAAAASLGFDMRF